MLDRWLLHAPLHEVTALVNAAAAEKLRTGERSDDFEALSALQDVLAGTPPPEPRPLDGELVPALLGIIPTRGCNLGCVYCNFGGPTAKRTAMDPRIAVSAVDWMAERVRRAGGEPFAAPEVVDVVVDRARAACASKGLVPSIEASTNGVFDEARCRFVGETFSSVVLSFDGPPELQNRNRPALDGRPTYEIVERTARRLSAMPVELCLRICVTHESVGHLREITRWMGESFRPAMINFEPLTPGDRALTAGLEPPDPYEFARHFIGASRVAESRGIRAVYSAAETETARLSLCPVGTDAFIVSPDGRASACYLPPEDWRARGLELDIGRVHPDGDVEIDVGVLDRVRRLPRAKPRCERCFCRWSCAGGCHVNQTWPGCDPAYSDFCTQTRIITACLLLRKLGQERLADELLADRKAMENLALHPRDAVAPGSSAWRSVAAASFEPECLTVGIAAEEVARHCVRKQKPFQLVLHGGGEPTLHWELLRRVVVSTQEIARRHGVDWRGYVATNGMLSEDRARWLGERFDRVGLSCDGPPDIQDLQRPSLGKRPSSEFVERTARILARSASHLTVRVTVTPQTVDRQAEIVSYVHRTLGATDIRLEPVYRSGATETIGFSPADAPRFVRHYLAAQCRAETVGCRLSLSGTRPGEVRRTATCSATSFSSLRRAD